MKTLQRWIGVGAILPALLGTALDAQQPRREYGIQAGIAVAGAPLGEVAESFGTFAVPGREYEARITTRSARGNEWSIGLIGDEYAMDHVIDINTRSTFDYQSYGVVLGRVWAERRSDVVLMYGVDAGWRRFTVDSSRPDFYTGDVVRSRTTGDAALVAVSFGVELPGWNGLVQPRLRLETNFPDFGGGDGYSALHRETDLGFRASIGLSLKTVVIGRR